MHGLEDLQFYDYIRGLTAAVAVCAAWRLGNRFRQEHKSYSTRLTEWAWVIAAVLFTLFVSPIEAILGNTSYRYSSFLSFLIAAAAWRAARPGGSLQRLDYDGIDEALKQGTAREKLDGTANPNTIKNYLDKPRDE